MNTLQVALDLLVVSDRLRTVDRDAVDRLAISMADVGLLSPIEVTHEAGRYRLISGAHRVAAARKLGWDRLAAVVFEGDPDQVRLREIDENLYRRELSPYDQATFLAERADVCQRLGLIPKHAHKLPGDQSANLALRTYSEEIADKFGISRRDMFRSLRRRRRIVDAVWTRIAGTWLAEKGQQLDLLAALPPVEQGQAVDLLLADDATRPKTVPEAIAIVHGVNDLPTSRDDEIANKLLALWRRASPKAKRAVAQAIGAEIVTITRKGFGA